MPTPRVGNCIFCDDIRSEVGNKVSLMGVYSADMLFSVPPPVAFRTLGIVAWIIFDVDDRPTHLTMRVLVPPARTEVLKIETNIEGELPLQYERDEYSKGQFRFTSTINGIQFTEEGFLEVMIDTERETVRTGRLRIRFNILDEAMSDHPTSWAIHAI
jgi:hypothetical protein